MQPCTHPAPAALDIRIAAGCARSPWLPSANRLEGRGLAANEAFTGWRRRRPSRMVSACPYRFRVVTTSRTARTSCSARPARFNNVRRAATRSRPFRQRSLISRKLWIGSPPAWSRRRKRSRNGTGTTDVDLDRDTLSPEARALRWHLFHVAARFRGAQDACPDARRWARTLLAAHADQHRSLSSVDHGASM